MSNKFVIVALLGCVWFLGCQGRVGTLRNLPAERQAQIVAMLKTGSYQVRECPGAVIIEPENKDAFLEVIGAACRTMAGGMEPEAVHLYTETGLREILDPEGNVLGYVSYDLQRTKVGVSSGANGVGRLYIARRHSGR